MIFLTLFEVTKDYFARWLSALVSFALYPIVIDGVFATITGVSRALHAEFSDPEWASNTGAPLRFFNMVLMAKGFIIATPFIAWSVSGNIMMPALSAGSGGSYAFARGLVGSQQVYDRYAIGGATLMKHRSHARFPYQAKSGLTRRPCLLPTVVAGRGPGHPARTRIQERTEYVV